MEIGLFRMPCFLSCRQLMWMTRTPLAVCQKSIWHHKSISRIEAYGLFKSGVLILRYVGAFQTLKATGIPLGELTGNTEIYHRNIYIMGLKMKSLKVSEVLCFTLCPRVTAARHLLVFILILPVWNRCFRGSFLVSNFFFEINKKILQVIHKVTTGLKAVSSKQILFCFSSDNMCSLKR